MAVPHTIFLFLFFIFIIPSLSYISTCRDNRNDNGVNQGQTQDFKLM